MFRNIFAMVVVVSAFALTGCSKCSEQPAADAPAADAAAPADAAALPVRGAAAPAPAAAAAPAPAGSQAGPGHHGAVGCWSIHWGGGRLRERHAPILAYRLPALP